MKRYLFTTFLWAGIILLLTYSESWPQEASPETPSAVAKIRAIAHILNGKTEYQNESDIVQVKSANQSDYENAVKNRLLYFQDQIRMIDSARVRIKAESNNSKINLVLSTGTVARNAVQLTELTNDAFYKLTQTREGDIQIDIERGVSILEIPKGEVEIIADRVLSQMTASSTTRAFFVVNPGDSSLIYLEQGKPGSFRFLDPATLADSSHTSLRQGDVALIHDGRVVDVSPISALAIVSPVAIANLIKYNNNTIWRRWWQRPEIYAGAAALIGAGVTAAILLRPESNDLPGPPGLPPDP